MTVIIHSIPALSDNYIHLLHDPDSGATAAIDPAEAEPVLAALAERGWTLTHVLNTHHHGDHVGGNLTLQVRTGCIIVGAADDRARIPGISQAVKEGDRFDIGSASAQVLEVPGHTRAHIAFWFASEHALFCGDTLFGLGCGRLFEGTATQMWTSLRKLRALPEDTRVYCAHEYTQANGRFALNLEPDNPELRQRMQRVNQLRAQHLPTVPSTLAEEKASNPFLRADLPEIAHSIGLEGSTAVDVFTAIRRRKDEFRG